MLVRFVNDSFILVHENCECNTLHSLNFSIVPCSQFTHKREFNNSLPFLNIEVYYILQLRRMLMVKMLLEKMLQSLEEQPCFKGVYTCF